MTVIGSILLALVFIGIAGTYVGHVGRSVTPAPARRRASARARRTARTVRGKLPPAVQRQIGKTARAQVPDGIRQHLAGAVPVLRQAARAARTPAGQPAAKAATAKPQPATPLRAVPAVPAGTPVRTLRPPQPVPAAPPRKDQPVTQPPVTAPSSSGADLFAALRVIVTHAETGGLQAKQRVLAQLAEVFEYSSGVVGGLARRLAEPDQNYPPSVWEPVTTSAAHVRAAHAALGEASSALAHLVSLSLGEASATGQKIPHHDQVNSGT